MTLKEFINQLQALPESYMGEQVFTKRGLFIVRVNSVKVNKVPTTASADSPVISVQPDRLVVILD